MTTAQYQNKAKPDQRPATPVKSDKSAPDKNVKDDKHMREHLSEKKIDKMVEDSFPASDPPSTY